MSLAGRDADRIRWRCRRGMLELDLVLNAFVGRHLESLDARHMAAFLRLLDRIDPELFDLVMARDETPDGDECEVLALMREAYAGSCGLTPDLSPERERGDSCRERLMPSAQI